MTTQRMTMPPKRPRDLNQWAKHMVDLTKNQAVAALGRLGGAALQDHLRRGYIANRPDGPRSFACVAWACRGTVSQ